MVTDRVLKKLNDRSGMALAAVIVIFAVVMIMSATMASLVYSDTMLSADDENGKKAYYAARSAVDVAETAILKHLGNLQDTKGQIINDISEEVYELNESFTNGIPATEEEYQTELDGILAGYADAIDDYIDQYNKFRSSILPASGTYVHKVTIDGFETDSNVFEVSVTPIPGNDPSDDILIKAFRLEAEATVNNKTIKAAKWVGIEIRPGEETLIETLKHVITEGNPIFDNAIYSYGDLMFGEGGGGGTVAQIVGGVVYEGNATNKTHVNADSIRQQIPPTPKDEIPEPVSMIPGDPDGAATIEALPEKTTTLPSSISAADNGYYKNRITLKGNYTVDTSAGDVILKFSSVVAHKSGYKFTISGGNNLYFYLYDEQEAGVDFNLDGQMNNETPFAVESSTSNIYFIIDQPVSQRDPKTNVMAFDLGKNKITMVNMYVYAPFTSITMKNSFDYTGSIIVGGFQLGNNAKVTYHAPEDGPATSDEGVGVGDPVPIPITGVQSMNYNHGSYWLKK